MFISHGIVGAEKTGSGSSEYPQRMYDMSSAKRLLKRFQYWLYVKSGLKKRDEDNWWKGACHANTCADVRIGMIERKDYEPWKEEPQFLYLQALHARVEWTRHMRPEWTWKQASDRVINPKW
jgi:hypothetical protein